MSKNKSDAIFGAIFGDICGSIYEWNNLKNLEDIKISLWENKQRFTDDTVLTCAVADWLAESKGATAENQREILEKTLNEYGHAFPKAGYGHIFREWLTKDKKEPMNSFGNGSGMRVSACGCVAKSYSEAKELAKLSAEVTHNHPDGIKGAQAIACGIYLAKRGVEKKDIKIILEDDFGYNFDIDFQAVHDSHKFDATCPVTVPQAIAAFLEGDNLEDIFTKAVWLGGDSDTIADMACALAAAYYGISDKLKCEIMDSLHYRLQNTILNFEDYITNGRN